MVDFVVGAIVVVLVGAALTYIIKAKKNGECIGCPDAKNCHSHKHSQGTVSACGGSCGSCTGCGGHTDMK